MYRRVLYRSLLVALLFLFSFQLVGYSHNVDNQDDGMNVDVIYDVLVETGYTGTIGDLVNAFKTDKAYTLVVLMGYKGTKLDWINAIFKGKENFNSKMTVGKNGHWYIGNTDTGIIAINDEVEKELKKSIERIELTKVEGNVDTYTIYFTDGSTLYTLFY